MPAARLIEAARPGIRIEHPEDYLVIPRFAETVERGREDLGQNASRPSHLPDLSIKSKFRGGHVCFEGGCHEGEDYGTPGTSPGVTWARSPCRVLRSSSGMPIGP